MGHSSSIIIRKKTLFNQSMKVSHIDINRTIGNFFITASNNTFTFSRRFRRLAKQKDVKKSFLFSARIGNVTSESLWENNDVELTLMFRVANRVIPWIAVKQSTIPGAGKGCFLLQPGKKGDVVTCFMGYQKSEKHGSNYAFSNIDPCKGKKKTPSFHYCGAHVINHHSGSRANVNIDFRGLITLKRDIQAGEELFLDYNRDAKCTICRRVMERKKKTRKCSIENCRRGSIVLDCDTCQYGLCKIHYDRNQILER